ncbi:hypothetical protein [Pseudoalteromonas luteoviolacea]|uniref:Uncharacterized protein n=1 Tax=Pseudoalteromonas luteoviolacea (strain 2ta16) TaxID=1353533 RepID=V4JH16_PSEL2|nr:hypothetical protein [Pseudoalteromonas luteoviolacea]ESP94247.1 hypothetical protein PL2TA16_02092 [Pseudoalteromonas luteoviolacea 2ta16]KZN30634.1 hypothetical protein N483_27345 [Pseudoalteromonas luteoviolacea NCIMB 1944]
MKSMWYLQLVALGIVSVWYLPVCYSATKILKNKYRELWTDYGSFELLGNNNVVSSYKLLKLILTTRYKSTNDSELISKMDTCRVLLLVAFVLAASQFVLTILMIGGYVK